ncbi:hypothetical protein D3C76_1781670 [compost metagenome]
MDCLVSRYTHHCSLSCAHPEKMIVRAVSELLDKESTKEACELDGANVSYKVNAVVSACLLHCT